MTCDIVKIHTTSTAVSRSYPFKVVENAHYEMIFCVQRNVHMWRISAFANLYGACIQSLFSALFSAGLATFYVELRTHVQSTVIQILFAAFLASITPFAYLSALPFPWHALPFCNYLSINVINGTVLTLIRCRAAPTCPNEPTEEIVTPCSLLTGWTTSI